VQGYGEVQGNQGKCGEILRKRALEWGIVLGNLRKKVQIINLL